MDEELLDKYIENPLNPFMFVEYEQEVTEEFKKILHIDRTFAKFEFQRSPAACNLLCIGSPNGRKSTVLKSLFKLNFEVPE